MFRLSKYIQENRRRIETELCNSPSRGFFSAGCYGQYAVTLPLLREYVKGRLIDLGCGLAPYRNLITDRVTAYDTLDFVQHDEITFCSNIQNMDIIGDESYDSAICIEVLEHVPDSLGALGEINRILKPNGILVLSVPHLSRLHDEPHDYYRFTAHGLRYLLERSGFSILSLKKRGGLFSFLGHQISTVVLGITWQIPIVRHLVWFLNKWLLVNVCFRIDEIADHAGTFAMGYSVAARKSGSTPFKQLHDKS